MLILFGILVAVLAVAFTAAWWHSEPRRSFKEEIRRILTHREKGK